MSTNDPHNPYQPPTSDRPPIMPSQGEFARCPNCGATSAKRVKWTFWGGALGPKMFSHVKCNQCFSKFNGKTGAYNTTPIAIYIVISSVIGVAACVLILRMMNN